MKRKLAKKTTGVKDMHEACPVGSCSHRDVYVETEVRCEQCGKIYVTTHKCNLRDSAKEKAKRATRCKSSVTLTERILRLEKGSSVPGTTISRVLVDVGIAEKHGLDISASNGESVVVWNIGVGSLGERKEWFFGNTIEDAVAKAEKAKKGRR